MNLNDRGGPVTDAPGSKKLWASVLIHALQDLHLRAAKIPPDAKPDYIKFLAVKNEQIGLDLQSANDLFFSADRREFLQRICDFVGMPVDQVVSAARRILITGERIAG